MKAALLVALALIQPAHSWYPYECCSDHDCEPVQDAVEVPGGYRIFPVNNAELLSEVEFDTTKEAPKPEEKK